VDIPSSYDSVAEAYAEHLFGELEHKPLDRHLLNRFCESMAGRGVVADLGCGPGHVTRYLGEAGLQVIGIDISPGMIALAAERTPSIEFRVGDMRKLDLEDASLAGIVAFYSIVHFTPGELPGVFREFRRVLCAGGLLLLAFHMGTERVARDELWGRPVALEFQFFEPHDVLAKLASAGFRVIELVEREPYPEVEYSSRRSYMLAERCYAG
jgi:ubiquinone/menaquinone biosynthesis C-methylase UbiE